MLRSFLRSSRPFIYRFNTVQSVPIPKRFTMSAPAATPDVALLKDEVTGDMVSKTFVLLRVKAYQVLR